VLALLRRLGDRFPQVVLITHIEQVRDGLEPRHSRFLRRHDRRERRARRYRHPGPPDASVAA